MNRQLFANNALSSLPADLGANALSIAVQPGAGALFPSPVSGTGDFFQVTLENPANGDVEICRCTARTTDFLTVVRGQEGFAARDFPAGSIVEARITKSTMDNLGQKIAGDIPNTIEPPAGQRSVRLDGSWVSERPVSPADALAQSRVDAVANANSPSAGNPMATMADVASEGTGLPVDITQALLGAASPSATNVFATVSQITTPGGGGTTLPTDIVDALLNTGQNPKGTNPYAVASQLPTIMGLLPTARLTAAALRALKNGSYGIGSTSITHPVLGSVSQSSLPTLLGSTTLPFAVASILTKEGQTYQIISLAIDRESNSYTPRLMAWEDDGLSAGTDQVNGANPKMWFRDVAQTPLQRGDNLSKLLVQLRERVDQLQVAPEDVPASAGAMRLSLLYEPFCQLEGFASGSDVFDGVVRVITAAWKTGTADPAVIAPKELFTVKGGVYGHMIDSLTGAYITVEQVTYWIANGTKLQVVHNSADPNVANLTVTVPFLPNLGGASAQALTRTGTKGLVQIAAGSAVSAALFRDGGAVPAGRLAYKDPTVANAVRNLAFTDDLGSLAGGVGYHADETVSPVQFAAGHLDAVTDLDLAGIATALTVNFNDLVATPAGRRGTAWFYTKNLTAGKQVSFAINAAGAVPAIPPVFNVYSRSTGVTSTPDGLKSDPSQPGNSMRPASFTIPIGDDTTVFFVAFFNMVAFSGIPDASVVPANFGGLKIGSAADGSGGVAVPWDAIYDRHSDLAPWVASLSYSMGDLTAAATQNIYPITTDVLASPSFSGIASVYIFAFVMSSTQLNAAIGSSRDAQFFGSGLSSYAMTKDNTIPNSRTIYAVARRSRGASPGVPITVAGATAISGIDAGTMLHTGTAFNSAEMALLLAQEASIVGANAATFSSAIPQNATVFEFELTPGLSTALALRGPNTITRNDQLIPVIYDPVHGVVRICA